MTDAELSREAVDDRTSVRTSLAVRLDALPCLGPVEVRWLCC